VAWLMTYQHLSALFGLAITGLIFYLLRRDHLHTRHVFWWLAVATAIAVFGIYPQLVDHMAQFLKIGYPPILVLVVAIGFILVKLLTIDLQQAQHERKIRRLTQQLALLEEQQRNPHE
jgi:hypothetical protein